MRIAVTVVAVTMLLCRESVWSLVAGLHQHRSVLLLYLVPASLYCLYNNLSFLSLAYFDPTTYFMFMQIRLLLTGLIYQVQRLSGLSSISI